jgi:L-threonylcarbamoyladenylate synthase
LFADIDNKIKDGVDYLVRHRQEDDEPGEPSTVIKLLDNGSYEVVRP